MSAEPVTVRQVTRSLCWLPRHYPDSAVDEERSGTWSREETTFRLLGRFGYRVTVVTFQIHDAQG